LREELGAWTEGQDRVGGFAQAGFVRVGEDDLGAAFAGEGDGAGAADAWFSRL